MRVPVETTVFELILFCTCFRTRSLISGLAISVAAACPLLSQGTELSLDKLVGVPFLGVQHPDDRSQIADTLSQSIKERLKQLQNWPADYNTRPPQKAVAIRYDEMSINPFVGFQYRQDYIRPHIGYWGGGWDYSSLEEATASAKKECGEKCIIFLENDNIVGMDRLIDDYIRTRDRYIEQQLNQIRKAELLLLIDRTIVGRPAVMPRRHVDPVPFPAEDQLHIGYPDGARDYLSACGDLIFYALLPVSTTQEAQFVRKLTAMEEMGIYGFYTRSAQVARAFTISSPGRMMDSMARFTKSVTFGSDPKATHRLILPKNLDDALAGQVIKRLWIEGSVRLSPNGVPLVTDMQVSPMAVRTDRTFYAGIEVHIPDDRSSCIF
jgi:hypothetical protein